MNPLNSRTATKVVANSVSKFGGILFTPIRLTEYAVLLTTVGQLLGVIEGKIETVVGTSGSNVEFHFRHTEQLEE